MVNATRYSNPMFVCEAEVVRVALDVDLLGAQPNFWLSVGAMSIHPQNVL